MQIKEIPNSQYATAYKKERGKRRTLESLLMQNIQDWLVRAV